MIPCNVDVATQTILTYAAEADPEGKRTLGVLTKPDLVSESATREAVLDLVKGKRRDIQLGYYVVKNRGADDKDSSREDRDRQEKLFFGEDPWVSLDKMRLGIPALRSRLRELLMERTRAEFPKVRDELNVRLAESKVQLKALGPARAEPDEQRQFLGKSITDFERLKRLALTAFYTNDPMFDKNPELKLVTRVREMNTAFAEMFFENAHTREFEIIGSESTPAVSHLKFPTPDSKNATRDDLYYLTFGVPIDTKNELEDILAEPCVCDPPETKTIMTHLENLYLTTRGYELGTVGLLYLSHPLRLPFQSMSFPVELTVCLDRWSNVAHSFQRAVQEVGIHHLGPCQQRHPRCPSLHSRACEGSVHRPPRS